MNIKHYLLDIGMSITEFSNKCGLPYTTIAELVNGKKTLSKCTAGTVYRIAKVARQRSNSACLQYSFYQKQTNKKRAEPNIIPPFYYIF